MRPEVHTRQISATLWLTALSGEHDLSTVPDLRYWLREPLAADANVIVDLTQATFVDLTQATFVDSGTLAELILSRRRLDVAPDKAFVLVVPPESAAAGLLDLVDAERRLFVTFESLTAALESFGVA